MAQFSLRVHGEDLRRAMMLLSAANIPTISSIHRHQAPSNWQMRGLSAVVDAESEEAAMTAVRSLIPDTYELERRGTPS